MKRSTAWFALAAVAIVVLAVVVTQFSSDQPDGLEFVAEQQGLADAAEDHALSDAPLADYGERQTANRAFAGAVGVLATFVVGFAVFWLVRSGRSEPPNPAAG